MEEVAYDTYLGDIISADGRNTRNIKKRVGKGLGIIADIVNLLGMINLGEYYFETVTLLRESVFLNGILTNAEIWYSLTKDEIKELEDLDLTLLRKVFKVPYSTPSEAYYLELGILSIETTIKKRRLNFFHYLLNRKEDEMLYSFFLTQFYNPTPGDWTEQAKLDFSDLDIPLDFEVLKKKSKESFKSLVKRKAEEYELLRLIKKQETHSKMEKLIYTELKPQKYMKTPGITTEQAQNLFRWRVRMSPFGENFRGGQALVVCPLCHNHLDNQQMALRCEVMNEEVTIECKIKEIYRDNISLQTSQNLLEVKNTRENMY